MFEAGYEFGNGLRWGDDEGNYERRGHNALKIDIKFLSRKKAAQYLYR